MIVGCILFKRNNDLIGKRRDDKNAVSCEVVAQIIILSCDDVQHIIEALSPSDHQQALQRHFRECYGDVTQQHVETGLPCRLRYLVESCLHFNPKFRPTAAQVLRLLSVERVDLLN